MVLPPGLAARAREAAGSRVGVSDDELVVIASHDCDVCARNENTEPDVELLAISLLRRDHLDGSFAHLKSPRKIVFIADLNGETLPCEARANRRWWIPRRDLLADRPLGQLLPEPPDLVARWLGRRYDRSALPDAFNERIAGVDAAIESAVSEHGHLITGLYVTLSDEAELTTAQPYEVILTAAIRPEVAGTDTRRHVQRVVDELGGHLSNCAGIDLRDSIVLTEEEITLHDLRVLRRLDMEALSYASTPPEVVPPHA